MVRLRFLPLIALAAAITGCGEDGRHETVPVSGIVVFPDGSPVRTGTIEFESKATDLTASGKIGTDGRFVLGTYEPADGAVVGFHRVMVLQMIINDGTVEHHLDHGKPVDPKFAVYESSGLRVTVHPTNKNDLRIEVTAAE